MGSAPPGKTVAGGRFLRADRRSTTYAHGRALALAACRVRLLRGLIRISSGGQMLGYSMRVARRRTIMRVLVCAATLLGAQSCAVPFFIARSSPASASTGPKLPLQPLEYLNKSPTVKDSLSSKKAGQSAREDQTRQPSA